MRLSAAQTRTARRYAVGMPLASLMMLGLLFHGAARGADWHYWDADGNGSPATGGSGNWTALNTWRNGSPTGSLGNWVDNNKPIFAGTAGTVGLGGAMVTLGASDDATNALRVETSGYVLNDGTLALQGGAGGGEPNIFVSGTLATNALIQSSGNVYKTGVGTMTLTSFDQIPVPGVIAVTDGFLDVGANAVTIRKDDGTRHNLALNGGLTSYGVVQGSGSLNTGPGGGDGYGNLLAWGLNGAPGNGGIAARGGQLTWDIGTYFNFNSGQGRSRLTFGSPSADSEAVLRAQETVVDGNGLSDTFFVVDNPNSATDVAKLVTWLSPRTNPGETSIIKNGDGALEIQLIPHSRHRDAPLDPLFTGTTIIRAGLLAWSSASSGMDPAPGAVSSPMVLGDGMTLVSGGVKAVASSNISLSGTQAITDGATAINLASGDKVLVIGQTTKAENGVYVASAGDWTKTSDVMDKGLRTWVQQGDNYGGRYVYQYSPGTEGSNDWRLDAGGDILNVALLTNGQCGIGSNITVVANGGGTSTLGGAPTQTGPSTFSGPITLYRDLQLTSSTTGANAVTFSGNVSQVGGPFTVTKVGPGTVVISGTGNNYSGGTTAAEGLLSFASVNALPPSGPLVAAAGGYIGAGFQATLANFLGRFDAANTQGVIGFEVNPSGAINLSSFGSNVRIHTRTAATLDNTNTVTPPGTVYRFGGGGGTLTVNGSLTNKTFPPATRSVEVGTSGNLPPGVTILGGANTYTGGTNVTAGYLVFAVPGAIPATGTIKVTEGGYAALAYSLSAADFLAKFNKAASSGVIGFESSVGGPIDLTGFNAAVRLGSRNEAALETDNVITPSGNTYRLGGGPGTLTVYSTLSDGGVPRSVDVGTSGALDAGTVVLAAGNTFTGTTTVTAGTLRLGHNTALGAATATVDLQNGTTLALDFFSPVVGLVRLTDGTITAAFGSSLTAPLFHVRKGTVSAVLAGGSLTKTTNDTVTLSEANTYTGVTTISGGTLSVNSLADGGTSSAIGAAAATADKLVLDGGTLAYTGTYFCGSDRLFTLTPQGGKISVAGNGSLNLTGAGPVALSGAGARLLTLDSSSQSPSTLSASLANASPSQPTSLSKTGSGTWVLAGNNTFTGPVTVSAGTLQIGAAGESGAIAGPTTLGRGTTLVFNRTNAWTYNQAITGYGSVVNSGSGVLALGGANTYMGGTTLNSGWTSVSAAGRLGTGPVTIKKATLQAAGAVAYTLSNPITLTDPASAIDVPNVAGVTLAGAVSGSGGLTKTGAGTLILASNAVFAGGTVISAGTLQVGNGGNLGGSIVNEGTLKFNRSDDSDFGSSVTGTGNLVKAGTGTLTISGYQNYGGATSVQQGTLKLNPVAVPGGMSLWLDADSGVQTSGFTASQWNDRSGLGRNATQANPASQPTYITNDLVAGHRVLHFNGVNSYFDVDLSFLANKGYTIFSVEGRTSNKDGNTYLGTGVQGAYDYNPEVPNVSLQVGYAVDQQSNVTTHYVDQWYNTTSYYATAYSLQEFKVWTNVLYPTVARDNFLNGVQQWNVSNGTPTPLTPATDSHHYWPATNGGRIGSGRNFNRISGTIRTAPSYYDGDLAEIIIYDRALDETERQAVEAYLMAKWLGIPGDPANDILPITTALSVSAGATFDLAGANQQVDSLADGTGGGTVTNSGTSDSTLKILGSDSTIFTGKILNGATNSISLVKDGSGRLTLGGMNDYSGGTTVDLGTLEIASAGGLPPGRSLTINEGGAVVLRSGLAATGAASFAPATGEPAPVPEPASVALVVAAGAMLSLLGWQRRLRRGGR